MFSHLAVGLAVILLVGLGASAASPPMLQDAPPLLFFDWNASTTLHDSSLELEMMPPIKGDRVVWPTESWETWAVFGYNSVLQLGPQEYRLYYDCIQGTGVPPGIAAGSRATGISHRRICLATSTDGLTWIKPNLGVFNLNGSTSNNILVEDSGVSVFVDTNPAAPATQKFKMACSTSVYASPDGITWTRMSNHTPVKAEDDTKPTAGYDSKLGKYIIYVRRDVKQPLHPGDVRAIGRCETTDFTNWELESPGGCPVVFEPDAMDPDGLDVYTNSWTPYPSAEAPSGHFFFPSFYHHFSSSTPFGFGNDGLLDVRLVVSSDGSNLTYVPGRRNRSPFIPLGINRCGSSASSPSVTGGWCSPTSGIENKTNFDTSAMYVASGFVSSVDGDELYLYASGQPFTHGGDAGNHLWGNNTGIRVLRLRKDGFTSVAAPYGPTLAPDALPALVTREIVVPQGCAPGHVAQNETSCSYEYPNDKCPPTAPAAVCKTDADCHAVLPSDPKLTCLGVEVSCISGVCGTGKPGGDLCVGREYVGGVSIGLNVETSVAGFALVEVQQNGKPVAGLELNNSAPIRGSALYASPSWKGGASLTQLAGSSVSLKIALTDARLFAVRVGCAS